MREFQVIEIVIETKDNDSVKKYRGHGILDRLEKAPGAGTGFQARVLVNIADPTEPNKQQGLPRPDREYAVTLAYRLVMSMSHLDTMQKIVDNYI